MELVIRNRYALPKTVSDFFESNGLLSAGTDGNGITSALPSVNVIENPEEYRIEMAVPGFDKEDFGIRLENSVLSVSAETEEEEDEEGENYHRREFSRTAFSRSFRLPENVDEENIEAGYEDGVLYIWLPKENITAPSTEKIEIDVV